MMLNLLQTIALVLMMSSCLAPPDAPEAGTPTDKATTGGTTTGGTTTGETTTGVHLDGELKSYADNLHNVLSYRCKTCHENLVSPAFAQLDPITSFNILKSSGKINLDSPESSRIYLRLKVDKHNCWTSNCDDNASLMLEAIKKIRVVNSSLTNPTPSAYETAGLIYSQQMKRTISLSDNLILEAEDLTLKGFQKTQSSGASGSNYIKSNDTVNPGEINFKFKAISSGRFRFIFRYLNATNRDNGLLLTLRKENSNGSLSAPISANVLNTSGFLAVNGFNPTNPHIKPFTRQGVDAFYFDDAMDVGAFGGDYNYHFDYELSPGYYHVTFVEKLKQTVLLDLIGIVSGAASELNRYVYSPSVRTVDKNGNPVNSLTSPKVVQFKSFLPLASSFIQKVDVKTFKFDVSEKLALPAGSAHFLLDAHIFGEYYVLYNPRFSGLNGRDVYVSNIRVAINKVSKLTDATFSTIDGVFSEDQLLSNSKLLLISELGPQSDSFSILIGTLRFKTTSDGESTPPTGEVAIEKACRNIELFKKTVYPMFKTLIWQKHHYDLAIKNFACSTHTASPAVGCIPPYNLDPVSLNHCMSCHNTPGHKMEITVDPVATCNNIIKRTNFSKPSESTIFRGMYGMYGHTKFVFAHVPAFEKKSDGSANLNEIKVNPHFYPSGRQSSAFPMPDLVFKDNTYNGNNFNLYQIYPDYHVNYTNIANVGNIFERMTEADLFPTGSGYTSLSTFLNALNVHLQNKGMTQLKITRVISAAKYYLIPFIDNFMLAEISKIDKPGPSFGQYKRFKDQCFENHSTFNANNYGTQSVCSCSDLSCKKFVTEIFRPAKYFFKKNVNGNWELEDNLELLQHHFETDINYPRDYSERRRLAPFVGIPGMINKTFISPFLPPPFTNTYIFDQAVMQRSNYVATGVDYWSSVHIYVKPEFRQTTPENRINEDAQILENTDRWRDVMLRWINSEKALMESEN